MFFNCQELSNLDLKNQFDTSEVNNMMGMFASCYKLASLDLKTNFVILDSTTIMNMFDNFAISIESSIIYCKEDVKPKINDLINKDKVTIDTSKY